MVIFATAAMAATLAAAAPAEARAQPSSTAAPERQAQATVRILSSAQLRFSEIERERPEALRESRVRGADGAVEAVKLVEFE